MRPTVGFTTHALSVLVLLSVIFGACTTEPLSPTSRTSGDGSRSSVAPVRKVLTIGATASVDGLGIISATTSAGGWSSIAEMNSNGLITADRQSRKPVGQLARMVPSLEDGSIAMLEDGRMRVTYHLRPGITWQDGTPFTPDDLVFTSRVLSDPALPTNHGVAAKLVDGVDAPDAQTFVIYFRKPYLNGATLGFSLFWPQPRHLLGEAYDRLEAGGSVDEFAHLAYWTNEYIHLGPYRLTSYEPAQGMTFEAYDGYFLGAPRIGRIDVRFFADENVLFTSLLAGTVHVLVSQAISTNLGFQLKDRWESSGDGVVYSVLTGTRYLVPQFRPSMQTEPANLDPRVRGALYQAIDREAVSDRESPAWSLLPPGDYLYDSARDGFRRYAYDPDRAKAVLREAGWMAESDGSLRNLADGRPFRSSIWTTIGSRDWETAIYADYWRRIGLDVEEYRIPGAQVRSLEFRARYPNWEASSSGYGEQILGRLEGPAGGPTNRWAGNRGGYDDPRAQDLIAAYNTSISESAQKGAMHALSEFVASELPIMPIYYGASHLAVRRGVRALDDIDGGADPSLPYGTYSRNAYLWDMD